MGGHVYSRLHEGKTIHWSAWAIGDADASEYLRSLLPAGPKQNNDPFISSGWPYRDLIKSVDLKTLQMVLPRADLSPGFPHEIVYSAKGIEFPWHFDLEATQKLNPEVKGTPFPSGVIATVYVVTTTSPLTLEMGNRAAVMKLPNAKLLKSFDVSLTATTRKLVEYAVNLPTGTRVNERFEIVRAWGYADPEHAAIYWIQLPEIWKDLKVMRVGEEIQVDGSGFDGGITQLIFLKINRP